MFFMIETHAIQMYEDLDDAQKDLDRLSKYDRDLEIVEVKSTMDELYDKYREQALEHQKLHRSYYKESDAWHGKF